jgi:peptide subunit release factor RF-3
MFFFAQERELADEAVAGDVIGIPNHGTLSVGDTLTAGSQRKVTGIPNFAPELIRRVRLPDAMRAKQLAKALCRRPPSSRGGCRDTFESRRKRPDRRATSAHSGRSR